MNTKIVKNTAILFIIFWVILGFVYPLLITVLSQIFFSSKANGSLITYQGKPIASKLICQPINNPKFFWFRPSATSDYPCDPMASGGSNLGPTNKKLIKEIEDRINILKSYDLNGPYPSDMVMGSGSGLEPYISVENAVLQAQRVSKYSGISYEKLIKLIYKVAKPREFFVFGESRVNVVRLNLELLKWMKKDRSQKAY